MNPGNGKGVLVLAGQSLTNGESVTTRIDTLGYDFLTLNINQTSTAASSNKLGTCKLSHGATTTAASATAITALVGGGAGGFTIPAAPTNTSVANVIKMNVDLRGKQRYLFLELSPLTTMTLTAFGELQRGEQAGNATVQGLAALVEG